MQYQHWCGCISVLYDLSSDVGKQWWVLRVQRVLTASVLFSVSDRAAGCLHFLTGLRGRAVLYTWLPLAPRENEMVWQQSACYIPHHRCGKITVARKEEATPHAIIYQSGMEYIFYILETSLMQRASHQFGFKKYIYFYLICSTWVAW